MAENCPEVLVGAGTVVNVEQAKLAVEMGAKYKADGTLNAIYLADEICGSSPTTTSVLSTTYEKSELIPNRERVRISYFHQRYYRLSVVPRFCLAQNRGLCTFDEAFLLLYNSSINQKGDCIWKFSTSAGRRPGCLFLRI